jgi:hypothetical protein
MEGDQLEATLKVKGFSKLSEVQKVMFLQIHKNHMKAMGSDNQKKYALENVQKVVWDKRENCLKVYYEDNWWHYDTRGTWY